MSSVPIIDLQKCTRCGLCVKDCFFNAIDKEKMNIIEKKCSLCGHCIAVCPVNAVSSDSISIEQINKVSDGFKFDFINLVRSRRSVRHYREEHVDDKIVADIVDVLNYTPTGTNSQATYVTVINSQQKIRDLSFKMMRFFHTFSKVFFNPITFPIFCVFLGVSLTKTIFRYRARLKKSLNENKDILTHNAPMVMIFHADTKRSAVPEQDAIIKATVGLYYAESLGLGTCFNGFLVKGFNASRKLKEIAGIPLNHRVYETFTAGYPDIKYQRTFCRLV